MKSRKNSKIVQKKHKKVDKKNEESIPTFNSVALNFFRSVENIRNILPVAISPVQDFFDENNKELNNLLKKIFPKKKLAKSGEVNFKLSSEEGKIIISLLEKRQSSAMALMVVPESLFVTAVSMFDLFLFEIVKLTLQSNPAMLGEKNISYSRLIKFDNVESAKEYLIGQEAEDIMREGKLKQIEWIEQKLATTFRGDTHLWGQIIEIFERRHVLVHGGGKISNQYLESCKKNNSPVSEDAKLGKKLQINREYFEQTIDSLLEFGVKLVEVTWRKLSPSNIEDADFFLNNTCVLLLNRNKAELASRLLSIVNLPSFKPFDDSTFRQLIINSALALKLTGKKAESFKLVNEHDWSAVDNTYKMAHAIIVDEYPKAIRVIKTMARMANKEDKAILRSQLEEWPLFLGIRDTPEFLKMYKELFRQDYFPKSDNTQETFNEMFGRRNH